MVRETVDVRDLAQRLSELLTVIANGDEVMLVQDEKPVARHEAWANFPSRDL